MDHIGLRTSTRRTTPAPQPPSLPKPISTRRRAMRSPGRHSEPPTATERAKPVRRSARQASVDSALGEPEPEASALLRAKRKAQKAAIADLSVVEESDAHVDIGLHSAPAPPSPSRQHPPVAPPRRSLGAASEMSGTTAISSFTLVDTDTLEPRFLLRHLVKLHLVVNEFMDFLVPRNGGMSEDNRRVELLHDATSDLAADYNDLDQQLRPHLVHYRAPHQRYIHMRTVRAALVGADRDAAATRTGLDLIIYQANLLVLAKDMIPLQENDKTMVEALRDLDITFPSLFLPTLTLDSKSAQSATGTSALLQETFELALELRTQLAISSLAHGLTDEAFDPDAALDQVFFNSQSENTLVRGWACAALGGNDSVLPEPFVDQVVMRMTAIREYFSAEEKGQGDVEHVKLDDLRAAYPWAALALRLTGWVRARNRELVAAVQQQGGAHRILKNVKAEREERAVPEEPGSTISGRQPRKSRSSFGNRRRSSGKFDPNAEVDTEVLSKLIAREGAARAPSTQESHNELTEPATTINSQDMDLMHHVDDTQTHQDIDWMHHVDDTQAHQNINTSIAAENVQAKPLEQVPDQSRPLHELEISQSSQQPRSTFDFVRIVKETRTSDKENHKTSMFARQRGAQRVPFGNPLDDSQPTPGPSRVGKEPQYSTAKKRKIAEVSDDDQNDEDEGAFETIHRSSHVQQQRAKAPKRIRSDPSSSGGPVVRQPQSGADNDGFRSIEEFQRPNIEKPSEPVGLEMTEVVPLRSTFEDIKSLAHTSSIYMARASTVHKPRRAKKMWTAAEEEALIAYMSDFPRQYAKILTVDRDSVQRYFHTLENGQWIAQRTQVDLKDKARVMAKTMIKSGAGLRPGFAGVITPAMERQLRDDGWDW